MILTSHKVFLIRCRLKHVKKKAKIFLRFYADMLISFSPHPKRVFLIFQYEKILPVLFFDGVGMTVLSNFHACHVVAHK